MSLPKWTLPVAIAGGLVLVLVLSDREPVTPEGQPVIDNPQQLQDTIKRAHDITQPIFERVDAGDEPTTEEKQKLIQAALLIDSGARFAPTQTNLLVGAGKAYLIAGQYDIAEARLRQALNTNQFDEDPMKKQILAEGYAQLSQLRFKLGDFQDALANANKAIKEEDQVPQYHVAKARALLELRREKDADDALHIALSLNPDHKLARQLHKLLEPNH